LQSQGQALCAPSNTTGVSQYAFDGSGGVHAAHIVAVTAM
jgi:hypothetical protein